MLNEIYYNLLKFLEKIVVAEIKDIASVNPAFDFLSSKNKIKISNLFEKRVLRQLIKSPRSYSDQPWITQYQALTPTTKPDLSLYSDGTGCASMNGGADSNEEIAILKAIGEALERFCLCVYRNKDLLVSAYDKILKKAIGPLKFAGISPGQRNKYQALGIKDNSIFRWVEMQSLITGKKVFIPAQLVYIGYQYHEREPIIQQQISTGAASANSFEGALYRGVCEAIERDSFMINFFNKLSPPIIDPESLKDEEIQKFLKIFKKYNLEFYLIDITTDIKVFSIAGLIIDRTGVGPAVHISAKTGLNKRDVMRGLIYESIRGSVSFSGISSPRYISKEKIDAIRNNPFSIKTFADRAYYWAFPEMIDKIEFFLKGPKVKINLEETDHYHKTDDKIKLRVVLDALKEQEIDIFGIDITLPQIKEEGIYIAKTVSPQLQPLYLNEGIRHVFGERMFNVPVKLGYKEKSLSESELNLLPHPFL